MKTYHQIICASYLFLFKDNKVLLLRRANTGFEDGNYSVPAGHVDTGETVADCLIREVKEETNIVIKKEDTLLSHVMHRAGTPTNLERIDFFFTCQKWTGEITNMEPQKCDALSWFDLERLPNNTINYIREAITQTFDKKLYSEFGW